MRVQSVPMASEAHWEQFASRYIKPIGSEDIDKIFHWERERPLKIFYNYGETTFEY